MHDITRVHIDDVTIYLCCYFAGEIGRAPAAVSDSLPTGELEGATAGPSEEEEPDNEVEEMQARLEALRS